MANLQKHRAHESLNMDSAAVWDIQAAKAVPASGAAVNVSGYHTIHLSTDLDIYFRFDTLGVVTGIVTTTDLVLKGGDTIYSLKVPLGLGETIYLIMEGADATVKIILS